MKTFSSSFDAMGAASGRAASSSTLLASVGNVWRAIVEFPRRRAVQDELSHLTDRELADIGLSRGDVPHVFDAGFADRCR
jgi:uncharacterized protein YjiS (DUF1127 family)